MPRRRSRAELEDEDAADDAALARGDTTTLILHKSVSPQGIAVVSTMIACVH